MHEIGCFVTPHGFGHATRVCAVLEALGKRAAFRPHIFSSIGENIFRQDLDNYVYHHVETDVGIVQSDSFAMDIEETVARLDSLLPYGDDILSRLASQCRNMSFILCDISPMGIAVAQAAAVPSVLVENFTWDYIYAPHTPTHAGLTAHSNYLASLYSLADHHIQTAPWCESKRANLRCGPIFRRTRKTRREIRQQLGWLKKRVVLVTLGGIGYTPAFLDRLADHPDYHFVFTGTPPGSGTSGDNTEFLPSFSGIHHPDLILGADIVVCKLGYSTLAECYQSSTPSLCIERSDFAESACLAAFAVEEMGATLLTQNGFVSGEWIDALYSLSSPPARQRLNGADAVARYLTPLLHDEERFR